MSWIEAVFKSEHFLPGLLVKTITSILIILGVSKMAWLNFEEFGVPDDYLPVMLIASILAAFLVVRGTYSHWYVKYGNGQEQNKFYKFSQVAAMICGAGAGLFSAKPITDAIGTGAGMWTYALFAFLIAGIVGYCLFFCFNKGIKAFILEHSAAAKDIAGAVKEGKENLEEAQQIIKQA